MNNPILAPSMSRISGDDILVAPEPAAPRIIEVQPLADYRLRVRFQNDEVRIVALGPVLEKGGFNHLKSPDAFECVFIDDVGGGIEWKSGASLSGDVLYYGFGE